jgi:hypothetical protein
MISPEVAKKSMETNYLEDGRKFEHLRNRHSVPSPAAYIVTEPVPNVASCSSKGTACDDHWSFGRSACQHCLSTGSGHHGAIEVVSVVHSQAVFVMEISVEGLVRQASSVVVDGVRGINQVSAG